MFSDDDHAELLSYTYPSPPSLFNDERMENQIVQLTASCNLPFPSSLIASLAIILSQKFLFSGFFAQFLASPHLFAQ